MADEMKRGGHQDRDDLSDAASSHLEQQSLKDEELPSYSDPQTTTTPALETGAPAGEDKSPLAREQYQYVASTEHQQSTRPGASRSTQYPTLLELSSESGPTASSPFNFPISELPAYSAAVDITKPLAIPQISPAPDSPFLSAFSRQLLSYGIPAETWYNFIDTVSAFVSANISQQALHHASDFAARIAEYHKQYAYEVTKKAQDIGKKAQRLQLGGVIGGVVGIATHSVGHVVGTVFNTHRNIWTKPRTPRERATVYIATANEDWFHGRGLHALLLDSEELARVLGASVQRLIAISSEGGFDPVKQLGLLKDVIAEVEVRKEEPLVNPGFDSGGASPGFVAGPSGANFAAQAEGGGQQHSSSNAAGKRPVVTGQIEVGVSTLWLVLTQESKVQAMEKERDSKGKGKGKDSKSRR